MSGSSKLHGASLPTLADGNAAGAPRHERKRRILAVTGALKGIGAGVARRLATDRLRVLVSYAAA